MRAIFISVLLAGSLVSGCGNSARSGAEGSSESSNTQVSATQNRITEAQIRQYYAEQSAALRDDNAQAICDGMGDDYRQTDHSQIVGGDPDHTGTFDKAKACQSARDSIALYQRLRTAGTPVVFTDNIETITIAPDGASARVHYRNNGTIGGRPLFESTSDENLVLRNGRVVSTGGESHIRAYVQN